MGKTPKPDHPLETATGHSQMYRFLIRGVVATSLHMAWALPAVSQSLSSLPPQERLHVKQVRDKVQDAGVAYQAGEFEQSGQHIREAMDLIGKALESGNAKVYRELSPAFGRIARAHALLELEGIRLPLFEKPTPPAADSPTPSPRPTKPEPEPADQGVSFSSDVAPILVQKCGNCHVQRNQGNFSLANFELLMRGIPGVGVVVFPGDDVGSRLIETIETKDMPRGGGSVPDDQLEILRTWVKQGAKFDGPSPRAPLVAYAKPRSGAAAQPATSAAAEMPSGIARPTGKETVSFARDVAPLLVNNCTGCHIDAMNNTSGGLSMNNFSQLINGGDSGPIIEPGKGDESLLVRKLRGQEGAIMPAGGRPRLSEESIALISTWIDEGATLDGGSPTQSIRVMASLAWAKAASHEELLERRKQNAEENWRLGVNTTSQQQTRRLENEQFFILGSVSPETIEMVAASAEAAAQKVKSVVPSTTDQPLYRGRVTLFVLPKRYEYAEFSRMVEKRTVPMQWSEHWNYDLIDAYLPIVVTGNDTEKEIADRLIGPLTSLAVAMQGIDVPRWFSEGIGRAATAKFAGRNNELVAAWKAELPKAFETVKKSDDLLKGRLNPEQADLISFALGSTILDRGGKRSFDQLLKYLADDLEFDEAFKKGFRAAPPEYLDQWLGKYTNAKW